MSNISKRDVDGMKKSTGKTTPMWVWKNANEFEAPPGKSRKFVLLLLNFEGFFELGVSYKTAGELGKVCKNSSLLNVRAHLQ